jgi:hypothetical protein
MIPKITARNVAMRRRPIDDSIEDVCMVLNFDYDISENETPSMMSQNITGSICRGQNAVKRSPIDGQYEMMCKLICFEDPRTFEYDSGSEYESDYDMSPPSTPTNKPTTLVCTNAPARPKRF